MVTNDIPMEGVLKYIKRERDKYKAEAERLQGKLDTIVPYTKKLEAEVNEKKDARIAELEREVESLNRKLEKAYERNDKLVAENSALISDYHKSDWYAEIQKRQKKRHEDLKELRAAYNRSLLEIFNLKNKKEE